MSPDKALRQQVEAMLQDRLSAEEIVIALGIEASEVARIVWQEQRERAQQRRIRKRLELCS